jgi:hypothetical protein
MIIRVSQGLSPGTRNMTPSQRGPVQLEVAHCHHWQRAVTGTQLASVRVTVSLRPRLSAGRRQGQDGAAGAGHHWQVTPGSTPPPITTDHVMIICVPHPGCPGPVRPGTQASIERRRARSRGPSRWPTPPAPRAGTPRRPQANLNSKPGYPSPLLRSCAGRLVTPPGPQARAA